MIEDMLQRRDEIYDRYSDWLFPLVLIFVILALFGGAAFLGGRECALRAGMLGLEHDFKFLSWVNCRVNVNDIWIPIENYLVTGG